MNKNLLGIWISILILISPCSYAVENLSKSTDIVNITNEPNTEKFVDPMTLIAIGESVMGFLGERKKATQLEQMQRYLESLSSNVKLIQEQNTRILDELSKLPSHMEEANRKDRLSSGYRQLQSYWDAFYLWRQDQWDIGSAAQLINAYREVSDLEVDNARTLELIKWGEFAIAISKGGLTTLVIEEITKKKGTIQDLIIQKEIQLSTSTAILLGDLKSQYVSNHSINGNFISVTWTMSPDRSVRQAYECNCKRDCEDVFCSTCYREIPDVAFHSARGAINSRINSNVTTIAMLQKEIAGLNALANHMLVPYLTVLKADQRFAGISDKEKVETLNFRANKSETNMLDMPLLTLKRNLDPNRGGRCNPQ